MSSKVSYKFLRNVRQCVRDIVFHRVFLRFSGNTSGIFSGGTNATPGSTPGGFNFTPNAGVAPTFQFGSNQNTGGFNFGAATAGSSPFMFGGASTPAGGTSSKLC